MSYEMTTIVRFYLSYDPLKMRFHSLQVNIISTRKRIVDTDIDCNVKYLHQNVITRVAIRLLCQDVIHRIKATSCDKTKYVFLRRLLDLTLCITPSGYSKDHKLPLSSYTCNMFMYSIDLFIRGFNEILCIS